MQPENPDHVKLHWWNGSGSATDGSLGKEGMEWEPVKFKTYKKTKL